MTRETGIDTHVVVVSDLRPDQPLILESLPGPGGSTTEERLGGKPSEGQHDLHIIAWTEDPITGSNPSRNGTVRYTRHGNQVQT